MSRPPLRILGPLLGLLLMAVVAPAMAGSSPTLFTLASGTPKVLAQGLQKSWPIKVSEDAAFNAVFRGGLWLPNPAGGRIYAKYQRHILHDNGTWTWIGTVSTVHGDQSVVLTFGKGGVFGLIPQASGYPLRIITKAGETRVVETSAAMSRSTQQLRLHSRPDYVVPPRLGSKAGMNTLSPEVAASVPMQAAASGTVTIDVMVAYTPDFVSELGSQSAAHTRIQNLVDITNQAYTASGVNQQIRLVNTVEVNYPDNTSNQSALDDITGIDDNGNPVPIPASLQGIAALRVQYGADLVSLIRSYDNATQGDCGVGWLIGAGQTQIVPSQSNAYGYSVVSDGSNGGYYCLDTTFAHELGHNMGDAHDRAHADGPGAYSYSYGYLGNGIDGFSTIMAYGTDTDTALAMFSNPNVSTCQNTPCGVPDSASNSADNAHSMNNTAALIAQFEPTMIANPPALETVHNDIDGDGESDLLWYSASAHRMSYWVMSGATMTSWQGFDVPVGYQPIGTGDFDGDGHADILWKSASGGLYMWLSKGSSFTSQYVGAYPAGGWVLAGTADINNDGKADLIWYNPTMGRVSYWLMDGATMTAWQGIWTNTGLKALATGKFDGNADSDIIWLTPNGTMVMWIFNASGNYNYYTMGQYPGGDWEFAGTGDVNGDGKTDLFWYSPSAGLMAYWLMNGPTVTSSQGFWTYTGMMPLATGTFDGSNAGLTWKGSSGQMYMWLFNIFNGSALNYYSMGAYPPGGYAPIP